MRISSIAAMGLALAGCVSTRPEPQMIGTEVPLSAKELAVVKRDGVSGLRDPASAQFGMILASKTPTGAVNVCGYVNAKNGFGGYTGAQPFIGNLAMTGNDGYFLVTGYGNSETSAFIMQMCRERGIRI